jgi:hypothetical protein
MVRSIQFHGPVSILMSLSFAGRRNGSLGRWSCFLEGILSAVDQTSLTGRMPLAGMRFAGLIHQDERLQRVLLTTVSLDSSFFFSSLSSALPTRIFALITVKSKQSVRCIKQKVRCGLAATASIGCIDVMVTIDSTHRNSSVDQ